MCLRCGRGQEAQGEGLGEWKGALVCPPWCGLALPFMQAGRSWAQPSAKAGQSWVPHVHS